MYRPISHSYQTSTNLALKCSRINDLLIKLDVRSSCDHIVERRRTFGLQRTNIEASFSPLGAKNLSQFISEPSRGEYVHVERDGERNVIERDGNESDESLFDLRSMRRRCGLV